MLLTMMDDILSFIRENPRSTMLQLCQGVNDFQGEFEWYMKFNTIIYSECSENAIRLLQSLIDCRAIFLEIIPPDLYYKDNFVPIYPIGKLRKTMYKLPHWIPIAFSYSPSLIEHWNGYPLNTNWSGWSVPRWKMFPELVKRKG